MLQVCPSALLAPAYVSQRHSSFATRAATSVRLFGDLLAMKNSEREGALFHFFIPNWAKGTFLFIYFFNVSIARTSQQHKPFPKKFAPLACVR